jgi:hypothetical protein
MPAAGGRRLISTAASRNRWWPSPESLTPQDKHPATSEILVVENPTDIAIHRCWHCKTRYLLYTQELRVLGQAALFVPWMGDGRLAEQRPGKGPLPMLHTTTLRNAVANGTFSHVYPGNIESVPLFSDQLGQSQRPCPTRDVMLPRCPS